MSLVSCLKKAGKVLSPENKAAVLALATQYREAGEKADAAGLRALQEHMAAISKARETSEAQLSQGQGGAVQTAEAMRKELAARFPEVVQALEQSGVLKLWDTLEAYNQAAPDAQLSEDFRGAQGMFLNGVAHLFGDGVTPGNAVPVFLHEVGEHASMKDMLGPRYKALVKQAWQLAKDGDPMAQMALMRIPENTPTKFMDSEMVAYLIEVAAGQQQELSPSLKTWMDEVVAAIKAFLFEKGLNIELSPQDIAALAVRAVEFQAAQGAKQTAQNILGIIPALSMGTLEQPAFHGSPHDFDRFSTDAIGTGEGAQAYGYGLYFAESKAVAEKYADSVKDMAAVSRIYEEMKRLADVMHADAIPGAYRQYRSDKGREAATRYDELMAQRDAIYNAPGKIYQVEIPDDVVAKMLLWDKPLSEQPANVQAAVKKTGVLKKLIAPDPLGVEVLDILGKDKKASLLLDSLGIPGIKYLDGGSRNRSLQEIKKEFLEQLPEDAGLDEVMELIGDGTFSSANEAILKALAANDWLGFDYPAQAISAALGKDLTQFDASPELVKAVTDAQVDATHNLVVFNDKNVQLTHKDGSPVTAAERAEFFQGAKDAPRGTLSFGNDITAVPSIIALLEGADLSTFLHESGHLFLEVQADLAARIQSRSIGGTNDTSDSEAQIVTDMNAILEWMGVNPADTGSRLDAWLLMPLEEKREHHEKWARGFEKYLGEGRAPSQELQSLFSKFRAWMLSVYQALKGLNVDLSDDVRGVMDRMLATDAAIEEAEMGRNMGPLFESPEKSGMTPAEYRDYQALGQRQTAEASAELDARLLKDMKWLSRARDKALKAKQEEVDELRREVRLEITSQVMAQPVYQVWQFLTGKHLRVEPGIQAIETVDPEKQSGKLRTKYLKESNPDEWKILSERRMTSDENGMDPEMVAAVIPGFGSADHMIKALAAAPAPQQLIEEMTDRAMLERYGDITTEEAMTQAADEAVHNEVRARVVATELKALEKATTVRAGKRSTVDAMARAAKEYAYQVIAGQRVRDLRPSQYSAAQARSAKLAMQSLGKSTEEAAMHKRNELINGYAAKAAYDAQEEVRALQKYMRKFDKRIDSIDQGYQDQIEQLLERFDFKPASLKAIDKRRSFRAWYDEQVEAGNPPDVPDALLDDSDRKSFKDMTVEELRGLRDTVKQIEHQGRLKKKLLLARDGRDFDAIAREVEASIIEHGGDKREVQLEGPNPVMDWFAGAWASHRKLGSLFRQMDGNKDTGPLYQFIGREMNDRSTMEDVALEKATEALRDLYAPMLKLRGGITGYRSKVFISEINASLTRGGRLAVALNWGNEANRQRIMDGDKWSVDQVQAILKTLSPVELEFVNKVWSFLDSYWPEIAAKEKRLTGVEPPKVEASPFNVLLPDGTEVAMAGGYFPLKYDTERSDKADQQEAAHAAKEMMQGVFTKATTRRGHTKERLKEVKRAVRKDLNVITQHVTQVVHDLAWHEWLIDTNKLLGDDRIAGAIRDHYGPKVLKTMRDGILGIATADVVPMTDVDKALLLVRSNVTRATMGASLTTAFLQPFGLTQSIVRIGGRHVLRGMARWGGEATRMESAVGWIHERSEFMRLRAKTFNRELREIRGAVAGKSRTMRVVDAGLFVMMQKMQMVADVPTWLGQYEKSKSEGLAEADAISMADRAVLDSQGGGATKDMAEVQRKHPMLTQFYSYFSTTLNLAAEQTAATDFKHPAAVAGWLGDMALLMVIPAILPSFILFGIKGGGGDDDDKSLARRMVEWQLSYLFGTVVLLRELSGVSSGYDYAGPPVARLGVDIARAAKQTIQGEIDEPLVMAYINLMGSAFGIPVVQAMRSYKGWKAWSVGQDGAGPQSVLFGPPAKD